MLSGNPAIQASLSHPFIRLSKLATQSTFDLQLGQPQHKSSHDSLYTIPTAYKPPYRCVYPVSQSLLTRDPDLPPHHGQRRRLHPHEARTCQIRPDRAHSLPAQSLAPRETLLRLVHVSTLADAFTPTDRLRLWREPLQ